MATNVDMSGDTLYVNDIFYNSATPGTLSGVSLSTQNANLASVSITTSTYAPTAAQSGSVFILSRLAGSTITLPVPVVGTIYDFSVGIINTSNSYKIITDAATTFLSGGILFDKALTVTRYEANGTTIRSLNFNGSTTGGAGIGDAFTLIAVSATQWSIQGMTLATGTLATPFATS